MSDMEFSIDRITVTAPIRSLKCEYTLETRNDLRAIHGVFYEGYIPVDGPISKHLKKYLKNTRWGECKCFCEWYNKPFPKRYSRKTRHLLKQHLERIQNESRRQDYLAMVDTLSNQIRKMIDDEILQEIMKSDICQNTQ
jgi:hypothetical protein